jgi:hypothetical protein
MEQAMRNMLSCLALYTTTHDIKHEYICSLLLSFLLLDDRLGNVMI